MLLQFSYDEETDIFVFTINDTTEKDAGRYKCEIENDFGYDEIELNLTVVEKPDEEIDHKKRLKMT